MQKCSLITSLAVSSAIALGCAASANAASLVIGDTVDLEYVGDVLSTSVSAIVGAGEDGNFFDNQFFDLNAGSGDQFYIRSIGSFCGIQACSGPVSLILSSLDFGAEFLTGITFLTNNVGATATIVSQSSVRFDWLEVSLVPETYLEVRFDSGDVMPPIPVPASLPLLLAGVGILGGLAFRQNRRGA
jgi:hypothetical protein